MRIYANDSLLVPGNGGKILGITLKKTKLFTFWARLLFHPKYIFLKNRIP